jgi:hypothetical protein
MRQLLDRLTDGLDRDAGGEAVLFHRAHLDERVEAADKCL